MNSNFHALELILSDCFLNKIRYCCGISNYVFRIRTFTSKIYGIQHLNYWQRLKALDLMSLQRRRERYLIIHMWKVLHCKCPNDIGIQFSVTLRHGQKAVVPSIAKSSSQRNQALHDNSFAVTGPRLWNVIPTHMHTIEDPLQFKVALTNFVKSFPDEPPAPGYSRRNGNSLLDWSGDKTVSIFSGRSTSSMTRWRIL